jgi:hypothetical protein
VNARLRGLRRPTRECRASCVAFHPDRTYALVLESYDFVLVYDWASETVTRIDLSAGAYALATGWSGRRVHPFEAGAWNTTASVPWFTTMSIWDVSSGFDAAPYLGDMSAFLRASAFRPGCDGGLIVGGKTTFSGSAGLLLEFAIEGGAACP